MDRKAWALIMLLGLALASALTIGCGGGEPQELDIAVKIQGEKLSPEKIQVKKDDKVTLVIETDQHGELHIDGYDIEQEVKPGEITRMYFVAHLQGGYQITFHPPKKGEQAKDLAKEEPKEQQEVDIGSLEVRPR